MQKRVFSWREIEITPGFYGQLIKGSPEDPDQHGPYAVICLFVSLLNV